MTQTQTLIARAALGAAAACGGYFLATSRRLLALDRPRFDRTLIAAFAVTRFGLFSLLFLILRIEPRGDIPHYYVPQGEMALRHMLIYRDIESSYAPLHPYLDGGLLHFWHSACVIILLSVIAEVLMYPLWLRIGRTMLPENTVRIAALLYLASPISLQFVSVDGQDNVIISALIALSIWMVIKRRELLSGFLLGLSVVAIKFLPLAFAPAFFLTIPRRWRFVATFTAIVVAVYGAVTFLHGNILQPLQREGTIKCSSNLWFVVETISGVQLPGPLLDLSVVIVFLVIFAMVARAALRHRGQFTMSALVYGLTAIDLALLIFSKKSWPPYLMMLLFPMCLLVARENAPHKKLRHLCFGVFSLLAVIEHSIWASIYINVPSYYLNIRLYHGEYSIALFLLVDVLLIGGYLWLLIESMRLIDPKPNTPALPSEPVLGVL